MLYVAMTAAELAGCRELPPRIAFMACRFSAHGTGLSNIPKDLPEGSVIMLSDETPLAGHDPKKILGQVSTLFDRFRPDGMVLDFRRPGAEELVKLLTKSLPGPVAVSELYAKTVDTPVFLDPRPLCRRSPEGAVWADAPPGSQTVTVTEKGVIISKLSVSFPPEKGLLHPRLGVRYRVKTEKDRVIITMTRGIEELEQGPFEKAFCLYTEYLAAIKAVEG